MKGVTGEQANMSEENIRFFWFYICIFLRFSVVTLLQGDRVRSYTCNDICRYSKVDMNKNVALQMNVISGSELFLFLS